jgi:hypothetical protein
MQTLGGSDGENISPACGKTTEILNLLNEKIERCGKRQSSWFGLKIEAVAMI